MRVNIAPGLPTIDGFSKLQLIGSGGFSQVYSARQDEFDRHVAVKVLNFRLESAKEKQRFEAECQAMARLSAHPHIVTLYSTTYTDDGFPVIVMELFGGGTLGDHAQGDRATVLDAGVKVSSALYFAHQLGVVHRDVKPKNVLLSEFGEPALTDFGISAITDRHDSATSTGITLAYAPPEALEGIADERSDVYSLAATMYAVLAGHHPHASPGAEQTRTELARKILYEDPPPLRKHGLSATFDTVLIRKGLAKDPDDRPADAKAFSELLRDLQRAESDLEVTPFVTASTSRPAQADATPHADADPSVTIVRTGRAAATEPAQEPAKRQRGARELIAVGAGATAIGLLALFLIFGRGSDSGTSTVIDDDVLQEDVSPVPDIDIYEGTVFAPTDVQVIRQLNGSVIVTWTDPNPTGATFEIQRVDGAGSADVPAVVSGTSHVLAGVTDSDAPCITMRTVGPAGRLSRDIDNPVCVGVDIASGLVISLVPPSCEAGACSFRIDASGLLEEGTVSITVEGPDGTDLNSVFGDVYETTADVDFRGAIDWRFSPQAQAPPGTYKVTVIDDLSQQTSVGDFEIVEP